MSSADEIKKLKDLLDDGAITLEEFEQQKKIILDSQKQNETDSPFSKLNFKKINITSKNKKNTLYCYCVINSFSIQI